MLVPANSRFSLDVLMLINCLFFLSDPYASFSSADAVGLGGPQIYYILVT
jgi:hypothetical protein